MDFAVSTEVGFCAASIVCLSVANLVSEKRSTAMGFSVYPSLAAVLALLAATAGFSTGCGDRSERHCHIVSVQFIHYSEALIKTVHHALSLRALGPTS